jgi:5-methylcytosine-specific restriction endonuclease McrA
LFAGIYYHIREEKEIFFLAPSPGRERSLFEQVLLLNASYEPLNVINWKRAIKLVFLNKVEVVEESERVVRSITVSVKVPSVVRLMGFVHFRRKDAKYSRRNIYARDKYRCQYCGRQHPMDDLTCDHVIPRSRGGRAEWDNIVTCCVSCNRKKGGNTPEEAGLHLIKKPAKPSWLWGFQVRFAGRRPPREWWTYLHIYLEGDIPY